MTDGHYKIPWVIMSKVSLVLSLRLSLALSLSLIYVLKGLRHADKEVAWICNMLDRAPQQRVGAVCTKPFRVSLDD